MMFKKMVYKQKVLAGGATAIIKGAKEGLSSQIGRMFS
jgi:hypothetical protein